MKLQRPGNREGLKTWRPGAADEPSTAEKPESPVGILLRASRLRCGKELPAIAQALRIRRGYLEALEEGRFNDLPGATYAVGFVRTYAEHLGLDGEEVVRRFKAEASGIHRSTALVFPLPATEGGIPGGALLLVGVLLAGLAYGGWYVLSTRDQTVAELVPNLPERFAALVENVRSSVSGASKGDETPIPTSPPSVSDSTVPGVPVPVPAPITQTPVAVPPPAPTTPPAAEMPPPPAAAPPVAVAAAPVATPAISDSPVSLSRAEAAPPPVPRAAATEPGRSPPAAAESRASSVPPAATLPPAPPAIPGASTDAADRQVAGLVETSNTSADGSNSGVGGGTSRIVVRARTDSWIQIRDDVGNQLLLTRLMRAGDTYEVPNRSGLKLLTGNAGALDILVDGEMTPSLGPVGAVRRDITLNAELLRSGAAARP